MKEINVTCNMSKSLQPTDLIVNNALHFMNVSFLM